MQLTCIGAISIRGKTIPIIDLKQIFSGDRSKTKLNCFEQKAIVVNVNNICFGFLVDSVDSIINYLDEEIKGFPKLVTRKHDMFLGCISNGNSEILLISAKNVLDDNEVFHITKGHSNLFNSDALEVKRSNKGAITTYLTLKMKDVFGTQINEVREIIEVYDDVLTPPGKSTQYAGLINLRGELVTLIDPAKLFSKDLNSSLKAIIFDYNNEFYGLIVESVESILKIGENEKSKLPELNTRGNSILKISGAFLYKDKNGLDSTLLTVQVAELIKSKSIEKVS